MRVKITALSFFLLCTLSVSAQRPATKEQQPTLSETLSWLREKIKASGFYKDVAEDENEKEVNDYHVDLISFDGCAVYLKSITKSYFLSDPRISVYTVEYRANMADFDSASITVLNRRQVFTVQVKTLSLRKKVQQHRELRGARSSGLTVDEAVNYFSVSFSDKGIAERAARAFSHAIKLCSTKKEPF